jgi:3-oxoacyl-[acyl-carrier-protein] synthase-3
MIALTIRGTGAVRPAADRTSEEVDVLIGRPSGWTEQHFAIRRRGLASPEETSSAMGAEAARQALAVAGWRAEDLDIVVGACGVMEQPIPGTACLIQRRLGLGSAGTPALDINATCLSFLAALDIVSLGMAAGRWKKALIVSADIASAALDFSDPEASAIFGDGAAAMCVEAGSETGSGLLGFRLETYGDGADYCSLPAGGTRIRPGDDLQAFLQSAHFRMDGPSLFREAARRFPRFLQRLLAQAGVTLADIDLVTPHQASAPAIEHLRRALGRGGPCVFDIFAEHGNQIAASMPTALHTAIRQGRLQRGQTVMLVGTAAGVSLGGAVLRY